MAAARRMTTRCRSARRAACRLQGRVDAAWRSRRAASSGRGSASVAGDAGRGHHGQDLVAHVRGQALGPGRHRVAPARTTDAALAVSDGRAARSARSVGRGRPDRLHHRPQHPHRIGRDGLVGDQLRGEAWCRRAGHRTSTAHTAATARGHRGAPVEQRLDLRRAPPGAGRPGPGDVAGPQATRCRDSTTAHGWRTRMTTGEAGNCSVSQPAARFMRTCLTTNRSARTTSIASARRSRPGRQLPSHHHVAQEPRPTRAHRRRPPASARHHAVAAAEPPAGQGLEQRAHARSAAQQLLHPGRAAPLGPEQADGGGQVPSPACPSRHSGVST